MNLMGWADDDLRSAFVEGALWRGANGSEAELEAMRLYPNGRPATECGYVSPGESMGWIRCYRKKGHIGEHYMVPYNPLD